MHTARTWIEQLELAPHPEGGWFRETHRSPVMLAQAALPEGYPGDRCAVTSILFLLEQGQASANHTVRGEEIWLHQGGDDLELTLGSPDGVQTRTLRLGHAPGARLQVVVPAGWWQTARPLAGAHGYGLVGCIVAPGFDFADFTLEPDA